MALKSTKNPSWDRATARYFKNVEQLSVKKVKEIMTDAHRFAAEHSPQYSGTFASNWRLSIGGARPGANTHGDEVQPKWRLVGDTWERDERSYRPKQEGDPAAIGEALSSPGAKLSQMRLGDRVYLSTKAVNRDTGELYSIDVEAGRIKFRGANPSAKRWGGRILQKTAAHVRETFLKVKTK